MSLTHWLVVIVIALLLFGRGKISDMMGDLAKGIKSFKKGMAEDDEAHVPLRTEEYDVTPPPAKLIEHEPEPAKRAAPKKTAAAKKAPAKRAKAKS
jgi:sec-independent protein translocase protein TatA